jgi:phosphoribosylanthranilate isomerase
MRTRVKICGLRTPETVAAACEAGAAYVGFNFFPKSPRSVLPALARALAVEVPVGIAKVALTVDADDATLDEIDRLVPLDMLQLHGSETPERVAEVKARFGLPVMKVVGVAERADVARIAEFEEVADQILVDAKAPKGAVLPGGNGLSFDWRLLEGRRWKTPWMLAGGLHAGNVAEAVLRTGARQIDLASGVERAPGEKSVELIRAFFAAVP